ncbi:MAG TPA: DUF559 domain-containing protein [Rhizomicrobium sp.]|nr:DUF559 domain-containing protein [Rhizomicrobium sp.]
MSEHPKADVLRRRQLKHGLARDLRANATEAERKLWRALRDKKMGALRFRRQQPIGPYVADFFCASAKLIVELDGSQHREEQAAAYDAARTRWLEDRGYVVLRFANVDYLKEPHTALSRIWEVAKARALDPSPKTLRVFDPPSRGG